MALKYIKQIRDKRLSSTMTHRSIFFMLYTKFIRDSKILLQGMFMKDQNMQ